MIWILLVIMQFKHFIADYPLQGKYMLGKFKDKGWILPLASHCFVHFIFTSLITGVITHRLDLSLIFAFIDFTIHFIMDRIKASPKMLGKFQALSKQEMITIIQQKEEFKTSQLDQNKIELNKINNLKLKSNVLFWWFLGIDQMVHHLTDILIIALIMGYK